MYPLFTVGRSLSMGGGLCPGEGVSVRETPRRNMGPATETPQKEHGTRDRPPGRTWDQQPTGSDIIQRPPPSCGQNWLTHACENITLPQTSFAGGKYAQITNKLTIFSSNVLKTNEFMCSYFYSKSVYSSQYFASFKEKWQGSILSVKYEETKACPYLVFCRLVYLWFLLLISERQNVVSKPS